MITVTIEGRRATAVGPMSVTMMRLIAGMDGRKTWRSTKSVSFDASADNINRLRASEEKISWVDRSGELAAIDRMAKMVTQEGVAEDVKTKYKPKLPLRDYQQKCLNLSWDREAYALFFEMGLGKTVTLITNCGMLYAAGKIRGAVILAPKGVERQWAEQEIPKHWDQKFKVNIIVWNGKGFDHDKIKPNAMNFYLLNTEAIRARGGPAVMEFINEMDGEVLMAIDESQKIKNGSAIVTKAALALGSHCAYRRIASGTPISRDVRDAWSQFMFLDERIFGIRYFGAFRNRYCIMGGWEGKQVIGQQRLEEFSQKMAPHCFRITKAEALDLPPKIYVTREYEMGDETKAKYASMKKLMLTELDDGSIITAANAASKLVRLQQILCGYLPSDDNVLSRFSSERIGILMEVVEQTEGKTAIWCRFRKDIEDVVAHLNKEFGDGSAVSYFGGTAKKERAKSVEGFMNGQARFFVSNPESGGTGLNLQGACQTVIYYSNSFAALGRWQSEDRTHRIGMTGPVTYIDLVARGSVDRLLISNLNKKQDIAALSLDDIRKALRGSGVSEEVAEMLA